MKGFYKLLTFEIATGYLQLAAGGFQKEDPNIY